MVVVVILPDHRPTTATGGLATTRPPLPSRGTGLELEGDQGYDHRDQDQSGGHSGQDADKGRGSAVAAASASRIEAGFISEVVEVGVTRLTIGMMVVASAQG